LRLSAWGARELHALKYAFPLGINWLPDLNEQQIRAEFESKRKSQGARLIVNSPLKPFSNRVWEALFKIAGINPNTRCSDLKSSDASRLMEVLKNTQVTVVGKSLNKEEFVTCGGVRLNEVNFKTMESRICPGLYFAGEILDIDGITGGFNFQAAWTTGWIAGKAMAAALKEG
jgi:predicted Rossmann fold flavoprotein